MRRPSSQGGLALCGEQILKDGGKFVVHEGALKVFHNLVLDVIVVHLESQQVWACSEMSNLNHELHGEVSSCPNGF